MPSLIYAAFRETLLVYSKKSNFSNAYNALFDDCVSKVDPVGDKPEPKLLELEASASNPHTVFIQPPEPAKDENGKEIVFTYKSKLTVLNRNNFLSRRSTIFIRN